MSNSRIVALAVLCVGSGVAVAADSSLSHCAAIDQDAGRLKCYDRLSGRLPPAADVEPVAAMPTAVMPAPAAAPVKVAPVRRAETARPPALATAPDERIYTEDDFGFENRSLIKGAQKLESYYIGDFTGWTGDTLFRLENGQVWKQVTSGRVTHRRVRPKITIKKATFGSFKLYVEGLNRGVRVKRVK